MLGVPDGDHDTIRRVVGGHHPQPGRDRAAVGRDDRRARPRRPAGASPNISAASLPERRRHPRADLLSSLIAAEEQGDRLTEGELLATCVLLFIAGHETTVNLIGNGLLALLQHRDQLAAPARATRR